MLFLVVPYKYINSITGLLINDLMFGYTVGR